jgi:hypothetical protein
MAGRRWLLLVLVAGVAFVAAFVVTSRGEDDDNPEPSTLDLDALDALSVTARELVALADQGSQVTHHAVYEQPGGLGLEVWADGERVREETRVDDGDHHLLLRTPDDAVDCVEASGDWTCEDTDAVPGLQSRVEQLTADLAGADVTEREDEVADLAVRCFEVTVAPDEVLEICLTPEGVLARLAAGDDRLELAQLDDDVDDDDFERPDGS